MDTWGGDPAGQFERHRAELTAYCYRMLGSAFEAEDAVQETLLRAWRHAAGFEGRASLRTWLYRIASNVCLDMLRGAQRRARPMDLTGPGAADTPLGDALPADAWVLPIPDGRVLPSTGDPAELAVARETLRLAFVAALQSLPPRQRAVLILCEVFDWPAREVAELLGTSVAAVNSALQRARATLAARRAAVDGGDAAARALDDREQALLAGYVAAFERYDLDALTALLREDATWSMPPYPLWLRGHEAIRRFCLGPGLACRDSRLVPVAANGSPAFGQYKPDGNGGYAPWALQVLELAGGRLAGVCFYLDTATLFPLFGLPPRLDGSARLQRHDVGQPRQREQRP
ncbi:MAG TPA: sigma-70 family RNA polymerase sigma factor [Thermomicrobiales bacterium]|nr:sigma-70 family RNA polymerase sigma factor [Thermomicrobiales bacterium]